MQEIINGLRYKLMALTIQKREGLDHVEKNIEKFFEFTSSITLKSALLASTTNTTFIIDLVLLWPLNHIRFTESIMAQG